MFLMRFTERAYLNHTADGVRSSPMAIFLVSLVPSYKRTYQAIKVGS